MRQPAGKLSDSDLKLRLAVRAAGIGIWDWDIASGRMGYSPRARGICGFLPEEAITIDKVRDVTHPDDLPFTSAQAQQALDPSVRAKEPYEYRIRRADTGEIRWVVAHGEAIFAEVNGEKRAVRYLGTLSDITERKASEAALKMSEMRQRLAIDAARMAVWELDVLSDTLTNSVELNRLFGYPDDACPTINDLRSRYMPGERERVAEEAQRAFAKGDHSFEAEFRCCRLDGEVRWFLLRAQPVYDKRNVLARAIGVIMDIDERKRAEERQHLLLRELNHRVKNSLAVIQSIATQTFRKQGAGREALSNFTERLGALAKANDILLSNEWKPFSALEMIERLTRPYGTPSERILIRGGDINLPARFNVPLALIIHELATNAAKYGSLASPDGTVTIDMTSVPEGFEIIWREHDGPSVPDSPSLGFGTTLITQVLGADIGKVNLRFEPTGVACHIKGRL